MINIEDTLTKIFEAKINKNCPIGSDGMSYFEFNKNKKNIIKNMANRITKNKYKFSPYKEFLILKGKESKPRCISIPTIRDRLCMYFLLNEMEKFNYNGKNIIPEIPQKSITTLNLTLNKKKYNFFMKYDISNFFNNFNHKILLSNIKMFLKNNNVIIDNKIFLKIIRDSINNYPKDERKYKGIPQGIPISSILSQIYMFNFENKIKEKLNNNVAYDYFRYVDDIIVICSKKDSCKINTALKKTFKEFKIKNNKNKEKNGNLYKNSFEFLGYSFKLNGIKSEVSIKDNSLKVLKKRIVNIINNYKNKKYNRVSMNMNSLIFSLNLLISGSVMENKFSNKKKYGWLFYFSQLNDIKLLFSLDVFVKKKLKKAFKNISDDTFDYINTEKLSDKEKLQFQQSTLDLSTFYFKKHKKMFLNSFVKSYRAIRKNNFNLFTFRFDKYSSDDKKYILQNIFKLKKTKNLDSSFNFYIYKKVKKSEQDIYNNIS
ncbi:reverse transcriptase domain-containing protein [Apilactobacillus micheneri]|uniref:reverse transcriptase domain-containing protein n=1 Tax=Apilactobacillus micheneri TaxID=1899430 RepID=UPI000D03B2D9|nr:reverse transcriptase domain-containing protein [Apilactobacillus micheneri]TPR37810.1 hypothetical protein DY116_00895 [Apilactobacillus micheneri]